MNSRHRKRPPGFNTRRASASAASIRVTFRKSETNSVEVDAAVGDRQPLGIGAHPLDACEDPLIERAGAPDRQHRLADIANQGASLNGGLVRNEALEGTQCDVSGAASDIEKILAWARRQPGHHSGFPPAMDAGAHQIVHQIVARGDAVEDAAHQRCLRLPRALDEARNRSGRLCLCRSSGRKITI